MAMARESARQQKAAISAQRQMLRADEAAQRAEIRHQRAQAQYQREAEREHKRQYLADMEAEAKWLTDAATARVAELEGVLTHTLKVDDAISFDSLRTPFKADPFRLSTALRNEQPRPDPARYHAGLRPPAGFAKLMPGAKRKFTAAFEAEQRRYEHEHQIWEEGERRRLKAIEAAKAEHEAAMQAAKAKAEMRDAEVDAFRGDYLAGDPEALIAYNGMVLERSTYPDGFPQKSSLAYTVASKMLVIEYELPTVDVVPKSVEYRYVRTRDAIDEKARKPTEIRAVYQDLIASIALRTMHEVFEADQAGAVETVCFNGFIHWIDPATGRDVQPHLVSVRASKADFMAINLAKVDRAVCLKNLGAQVSRGASEAQPVRPIIEFNMADARFIDQTDLVSGLSNAQNLMDLSPSEFEQLVANTFSRMGLESRLTRSSRDGGVDCVAFDPRPILGGKVVIQAKRYRHTVGVSAVRDLYGTMMNEGANKGILVTTSGYGPDAFKFAADKPIELLDGGGLLFLLQEQGVDARIIFPEGEDV